MLKAEHNARVHLVASIVVLCLALFFEVSRQDWVFLIIAISVVWMAEAFNTSIETLSDVVEPNYSPIAKRIKDVSAAAVMFSAIGALLVGVLVLSPYIW